MGLRHLRYFAAVAELRNVTQAARRLHVAQPALSRQIQDLEEELGVKLLERSTRGIKLTEAGTFFADEQRGIHKALGARPLKKSVHNPSVIARGAREAPPHTKRSWQRCRPARCR